MTPGLWFFLVGGAVYVLLLCALFRINPPETGGEK